MASLLKVKSFCSPLNFRFKDRVQLNFQSSTLCISDNSSQSSGFPHLRRYSCPPSTAHDPQEQNLKSYTVQLSITSLHFLHRIIFLTIFIMHVTRSQSSAFISFFESQIVFSRLLSQTSTICNQSSRVSLRKMIGFTSMVSMSLQRIRNRISSKRLKGLERMFFSTSFRV